MSLPPFLVTGAHRRARGRPTGPSVGTWMSLGSYALD